MKDHVTSLGKSGRLVIPAAIRRRLEIAPGDPLVLRVDDGGLHITTPRQAIRRAQDIVARYVPPDRRLSDELLAERRDEGADE